MWLHVQTFALGCYLYPEIADAVGRKFAGAN